MAHDWGGIIDYEKAHDRPSLFDNDDDDNYDLMNKKDAHVRSTNRNYL